MIERALRVAAAASVIIVGVWAGARVYSSRMASDSNPHGGMTIPVGQASPPIPSDLIDEAAAPGIVTSGAKIPSSLPDFALKDLTGKLTPIKHWGGKSLVINFWATWCAPCRREIPMLKDLSLEWAERGVAVIGIAVDHRDEVSNYAKEFKIEYPLLVGEQDGLDIAGELGVDSPVFPFTVFTDRKGEVVALYIGELHRSQANLILSAVENVNRDRVGLREARINITEGLRALPVDKPG